MDSLKQNPISFSFKKSIAILLFILTINLGLDILNSYWLEENMLFEIFQKLLLVAIVLLAIKRSHLSEKIKSNKQTFIFGGISLVLTAISFLYLHNLIENQQLDIHWNQHLLFLISCLTVGWFEELLFRVFIFFSAHKLLRKRSLFRSIYLTAFIFALAHLPGVRTLGLSIVIQLIFAFGMGVLLQSLYLRFNSILLVVTLHGLINYLGSYQSNLFLAYQTNTSSYSFSGFLGNLLFVVVLNVFLIVISRLLIKNKISGEMV